MGPRVHRRGSARARSSSTRFDRLGAKLVDFFLVLLAVRAAEFLKFGRGHRDSFGGRSFFDRLGFRRFVGFGPGGFPARRGARRRLGGGARARSRARRGRARSGCERGGGGGAGKSFG